MMDDTTRELEALHLSDKRHGTARVIVEAVPDNQRAWRSTGERVAMIGSLRLTQNDVAALIDSALFTEDERESIADRVKQQGYYNAVRSYAESIKTDLADGDIEDRDALIERLDSDADGSAWVIYTANAQDVIRYSENSDAYVEEMGGVPMNSRDSINWSALAMMAFRADIMRHLEAIGVDVNQPFSCAECSDAFDTREELTEHANDEHNADADRTAEIGEE